MKLLELFNSKSKLTIEHDTSEYFSVSTVINGKKIDFDADNGDHKGFYISFSTPDVPRYTSIFALTNDGHAPQVLAFVKQCLELLVDKYAPEMISFSAAGSRGPVYKRMLDKFMPKEYKLDYYDGSRDSEGQREESQFTLTKKHEAR